MADICVFCGNEGDEFDPEHWFPQWLSRALIPKHAEMVVLDNPPRQKRYFDLTVDHVCKTCNHGWLSDIESQAKPHVLPLILGAVPSKFTARSLVHVATWCYLKAISLELARPLEHTPTHPASVYAAFKKSRRPPHPNCSLALGVRDIIDRHPVFLWFKSQGLNYDAGPGRPPEVGYHTTLLIGHLVIDVIGTIRAVNLDAEHREGFHVLWPLPVTGGTFRWPPTKRFTGIREDNLV